MARKHLRTLTAFDRTFVWSMRWSYDRDGARIVHLTVLHAEDGRPRGQPLRARLLSREPAYPAQTAVALPSDARAALDFARARGWDGTRTHWLLPTSGLALPGLVLSTPTRLREWSGTRTLYVARYASGALVAPVAAALGAVAVPAAAAGAEAQWSGPRAFVLHDRSGPYFSVYTCDVLDLVAVLQEAHRIDPRAGATLRGLPSRARGTVIQEAVSDGGIAWAGAPGATRYPGARDDDANWVIEDKDGVRIESCVHQGKGPARLRYWTTLRAGGGAIIDRRIRG